MVDVALVVPDELFGFGLDETISIAKRAENAGFHSVWKGEASASSSFTTLGAIARETDEIRLATGIANVYSRSPALLAMEAATLDSLSEGRAILGLGTSSAPLVEGWHGMAFDRPLRRTRETIEVVRQTVETCAVEYDGEVFDLGPYRAHFDTPRDDIPIFNAAMGETNRRLTGEYADGWFPMYVPLRSLSDVAATVTGAAKRTGRDPDDVAVAPRVPVVAADDSADAEQLARECLALELGSGYSEVVERFGYGASAEEIRSLWTSGDRDGAAGAITDEMLAEFAVFGTESECREQLERYHDAGAELLVTSPPITGSRQEIETTVDTLCSIA
jgi:F420-dependent oxidoreductase-like protein